MSIDGATTRAATAAGTGNGQAENLRQATEFLSALFGPRDYCLFRPIETWAENDQKKSRVDYKGIQYVPGVLAAIVERQAERAKATRCNLFFGVCPRFGAKQYDLAWQIRVVRVLWSDVDDCRPDEAIERCKAAGLPAPSIVVSSGNGAHLYWLLAEPYLVDDVGDPLPVKTEWIGQGEGKKKKPHRYLIDLATKEKLSLDAKQNVPDLSPKAQHVQDIIAGIASKIGGDHTHDLARILRIPGTLNRKDERNGREPVPCTLLECDPARRYPIEEFERFVDASPAKAKREQLATVKLPTAKKLSPGRRDKFNELVTACAVAEVGQRSEADFALCCYAIEHGQAREEVWGQVQGVGKFAEAEERYFSTTWEKAEKHTRAAIFDRVWKKAEASAARKGKGGDDEQVEITVDLLADDITGRNHFVQDAGGKLYRYVDGVYKRKAESYVKAEVKRLCNALGAASSWGSRLASEVVEYIRVDSPELWERPPSGVLNVANGLLRVCDRVLLPHSPDHLSPVQLPVVYDPEAKCPHIDSFVNQVFPEDAHALAWEVPAWLMRPDTSIQKAVLATGEGANGKSTWLNLVSHFLGKGNTSAVSLHKLEADKFSGARLIGKLANICPDLPSEHLAGTSMFKAITGGDPIPAEYKFRDSFEFIPFARLVFSANHPPQSADSSHAFFRRWLVIPFDRTFSPEEQIPRDILDEMLMAPSELSGMLNKCLDAADRLAEYRAFSEPESVKRAWLDFHATTDPLAVWLDKFTVDDPDAIVAIKTLRAAYNGQAAREGRPVYPAKTFTMTVKRLRPDIDTKQRTYAGRVQWCYVGLGLTHEDTPMYQNH